VLLLSNDDNYDLFSSWLDGVDGIEWTPRNRRRADLFTLYLQRVVTNTCDQRPAVAG
jgi:hypothetical protein